jgi:hypothetical protein
MTFFQDSCFPLAFGVPLLLMVVALGNLQKLSSVIGGIRTRDLQFEIIGNVLRAVYTPLIEGKLSPVVDFGS